MSEISQNKYEEAVQQKNAAMEVINAYHKQEADRFERRIASGEPFTDDELIYSAATLCACGHGLAYPKKCGGNHYWDCSAILKGIEDKTVKHSGRLPFAFYDVKGESDHRGTTRGVFRPRPSECP